MDFYRTAWPMQSAAFAFPGPCCTKGTAFRQCEQDTGSLTCKEGVLRRKNEFAVESTALPQVKGALLLRRLAGQRRAPLPSAALTGPGLVRAEPDCKRMTLLCLRWSRHCCRCSLPALQTQYVGDMQPEFPSHLYMHVLLSCKVRQEFPWTCLMQKDCADV